MTTITRERLEWLSKISGRDDMDDINGDEIRELARIALASMDAKPVYQYRERTYSEWQECSERYYRVAKEMNAGLTRVLYTTPPAPVVPDEIEPGSNNTYDYVDGWNACRAAMLKGDAK
ncbi:hypothetical protein RI864_002084 [Salmonella enterica]|nr:hypothetical protein [Salmonella enterica]EAA9130244.1 hypothetical protein [Salmonella enterica]EAM8742362.1 hypothetical protein [Salmonella enterica]EAZ9079258.1 hypothetical protein [Salmonella enterica]EBA8598815.1 hypothetical protein [Salmonella enterica]